MLRQILRALPLLTVVAVTTAASAGVPSSLRPSRPGEQSSGLPCATTLACSECSEEDYLAPCLGLTPDGHVMCCTCPYVIGDDDDDEF